MKKLNLILLGILGVAVILFYMSKDPNQKPPTTFLVEQVEVDKSNKFGWSIKGKVRNLANSDVRGYVSIKFLDSNGNITYSTRTRVNDGDLFTHNQTAPFEYHTQPENFTGVTDFDVEFIRN